MKPKSKTNDLNRKARKISSQTAERINTLIHISQRLTKELGRHATAEELALEADIVPVQARRAILEFTAEDQKMDP
ncbi:MAG: hypothetical protein WCF84_21375 [Anaerolineae bacterium]